MTELENDPDHAREWEYDKECEKAQETKMNFSAWQLLQLMAASAYSDRGLTRDVWRMEIKKDYPNALRRFDESLDKLLAKGFMRCKLDGRISVNHTGYEMAKQRITEMPSTMKLKELLMDAQVAMSEIYNSHDGRFFRRDMAKRLEEMRRKLP